MIAKVTKHFNIAFSKCLILHLESHPNGHVLEVTKILIFCNLKVTKNVIKYYLMS